MSAEELATLMSMMGEGGPDLAAPPAQARAEFEGLLATVPVAPDLKIEPAKAGGVSGLWVAAPGENIVTTYPFGTYAAASGTSFSAPMVAGTFALLLDAGGNPTPAQAADAISHARYPSPELGNGRLDVHDAVLAWILSRP